MKKEIKEKLIIFLFILMIMIGLGIILYPIISNKINEKHYQEIIKNYDNKVNKKENKENEEALKEARMYNETLSRGRIEDVFQNPTKTMSNEYLDILNVDKNGMMGYISIPKIDVRIPIYHGTSNEILQKGVGHLEGSSLPVGGKSTHAILSAHRGLPSSRLFTDLNELEKGDIFYLYILDEVFAYKVNQVLVTEPDETKALEIVNGKDYVTLVTCTPYGVNTQRLLVRGERMKDNEKKGKEIKTEKNVSTQEVIIYISLIIALAMITITIITIIFHKKKKEKEEREIEVI